MTPEALLAKSKNAVGATDETRTRALNFFLSTTPELRSKISTLGKFDKPNEITMVCGDENERVGARFGIFPLWSAVVEDMIAEEITMSQSTHKDSTNLAGGKVSQNGGAA